MIINALLVDSQLKNAVIYLFIPGSKKQNLVIQIKRVHQEKIHYGLKNLNPTSANYSFTIFQDKTELNAIKIIRDQWQKRRNNMEPIP